MNALEQEIREQREAEARKTKETKEKNEIGSVCSSSSKGPVPSELDALRRELEAEFGPEEAAALLKEAGYNR